jgi:hypothetical protein
MNVISMKRTLMYAVLNIWFIPFTSAAPSLPHMTLESSVRSVAPVREHIVTCRGMRDE